MDWSGLPCSTPCLILQASWFFLPIVGVMTTYLVKFFPEHKEQLCVHISNTPIEEVEAAVIALKNEIIHLLQECQLYTLRLLHIDKTLVFEEPLHFEKCKKKRYRLKTFTAISRIYIPPLLPITRLFKPKT